MTATEKYLTPENILTSNNFDDYCSKIPEFFFKKEVPNDVVRNFEVVEKLLALSYFEYKFIDEAYAKAISTFEMAMSLRYKDFYPLSKKMMFNNLIHDLSAKGVFDTHIGILKRIKSIRNRYAHPENHSFAGIIIWNRIEQINRLINEMYEDITLRLERRHLFDAAIRTLDLYNLNRELVIHIQDARTILFKLDLLFINNKISPHSYLFSCTPLFNIEVNGASIKVPFSFPSKLINVTFVDGALFGTSFLAKQRIQFTPIVQNKDLQDEYNKWKNEYHQIENKFLFEAAIDDYLHDILIPELQIFQRM